MEDSHDWWRTLPCHLNPEWKLHDQSELDVRKLKHQVEDDLRSAPTVMRVENLLYQAFLEIPPKPFLRFDLSRPQKALLFLKEAEDFIDITMRDDADAHNGYGIVINAFRMWIYDKGNGIKREKTQTEITLRKLKSWQNEKSLAFVNATRAATLSRLGLERCEEAIQLFEMALKQFPKNIHWMFIRAIMQGRLARTARSTMYGNRDLSSEMKEAFERERELLEDIRKEDANFTWPIAYLGQCLYHLKKTDDAFECLDKAMEGNEKNTDIALISARVYKWDKNFKKSEEILNSLPEESKTSEVFLQLGLIYDGRAKEVLHHPGFKRNKKKESKKLVEKALEYVEKALEKDICHIPAAKTKAELRARIGDREDAKRLYFDLFHREDTLPLNQFHIRRSANLKSVRALFDAPDVLDNIFSMLDLCIKNFTTFDETGVGKFKDTVKDEAEKFLEELKKMSKHNNDEIKFVGTKYLAEVQRRLGNYEDGKQLILGLIDKPEKNEDGKQLIPSLIDQPGKYMAELRWNLGKCYCGLGELNEAEREAKTLTELPPKRRFRAEEIYADVYLARAKEKQISKAKEDYNIYRIENLKKAINKGSIEACYLYLTQVECLQERLCSLEDTIVQTIVEIEACIERSDTFHETFEESPDDPIDFIKKKITSILVYPVQADEPLPENFTKRYESLSKIRTYLRDFEGCYLQLRGSSVLWNKVCQAAANKVLSNARNLLDHVICDYQKEFRKKPGNPKETKFPLHIDNKKAEVNKELVKQKFAGYVRPMFPGYIMPKEMVDFFIELQPMYSKDNLWLAALRYFTNSEKHSGIDDECSDTYYIHLIEAEDEPCKKVDLVRRSCYEVEKIVNKIISYLQAHRPCSGFGAYLFHCQFIDDSSPGI